MDRVVKDIKDLTFLNWSKIRESSGTAGSFLKSYIKYQNKKIYFKLSDYNNIDNNFGHECINEIIIDRLLDILGVEHLKYYLINSKIYLDDKMINTYVCASLDFKEKGEVKNSFDTFYELKKFKNEGILEFCERYGFTDYIYNMIIVDYIILNRDRHGANIEVLYDERANKYRIAPIFDHGLSLLCKTEEQDLDNFDVMEDKKTNSFIGSRSLLDNLKLVKKMPKLNSLKVEDKEKLFYKLEGIISKKRIEKTWEMIWKRWCYYESLCNKE
ncbi:MAG: hypothetical protein IJX78_03585 [Bacilli bacterium]|nr:hypothetical protein [Bacilli bacterium]